MKRLVRIFLAAIALLGTSLVSKAQNDGITFTLLPQMPYANYFNPGIKMPYNGFIGLGVSNINYSIYNSSVRYKNLYGVNANGEEVIDGIKLVNSLNEQDNFINGKISFDVFNIGYRINKLFIDISWRMKINSELQFSKDFVGLFVLGNGNYLGRENPCDFNLGIDIAAYSEFGVGIQYDINDKLTVGVRPKLLLGVANVVIRNEDTKIYTDADSYAISADVNLDIKASSNFNWELNRLGDLTNFIDFDNLSIQDFFHFKNNYGLGVDFGASYVFNKHFGVSAGAYDIGFITWRQAKVKKTTKDNLAINDAVFDDITDVVNMNLNYQSMLTDVIDEIWGDDELVDGNAYTTMLKTKIMLQGYYELNPMVRATAIGQMYFSKGKVYPAMTLAYSGSFWNHLNLTLNCTMSKYTGTAFGTGIGAHFGPFNIYAVTDNILSVTTIGASTLESVTTYRQTNARFGIVWTW